VKSKSRIRKEASGVREASGTREEQKLDVLKMKISRISKPVSPSGGAKPNIPRPPEEEKSGGNKKIKIKIKK
jgi:hypothetical protein